MRVVLLILSFLGGPQHEERGHLSRNTSVDMVSGSIVHAKKTRPLH